MGFTVNQEQAISLRNRNILVSAAAGSGKTSVLVERIIRRITDEENPVSVDRLLIMTFTNAAAKEMKDRIREAIEAKLSEKPFDENLMRQSVLVHNAKITTIHGFCQNIIRDHFEELSIEPNFRVGDSNECELLRMDVIDSVLEGFYERADEKFLDAVESLSASKTDEKFAKIVLKVYEFIMSNPKPEEFLDDFRKVYEVEDKKSFSKMHFIQEYIINAQKRIQEYVNIADEILTYISEVPALDNYTGTIESDKDRLIQLLEGKDYEDFRSRLSVFSFEKLKPIRAKDLSEDDVIAKDYVQALRTVYKDGIDKKIKPGFKSSIDTVYEDMCACKDVVGVVIDVVRAFKEEYSSRKRDKNIIDFNDMEHMAIDILKGNPEIAEGYRRLFDEIYVDEYQDSNMTQETLLELIGRVGKDSNLFMVGDVKQSIYRFRQARPDLFIGKYNSYTDTQSLNQRVLLNDNFRSRREVLDTVNEIFSVIMTEDVGGIVYDEAASLKYGAVYYDEANANGCGDANLNEDDAKYDYKSELLVGIEGELSKYELEANIIVNRIKSLLQDKLQVLDKHTHALRDVMYKDIVILVRSIKGWEEPLKTVLASAGIPVALTSREGYFNTVEIETALAFLTAVDNPLQDIPLATVMTSPIFAFTGVDMATLRVEHTDEYLYETVQRYALLDEQDSNNEGLKAKCIHLIDKLDYYRQKSVYTPVYGILREFIDTEYGDYVLSGAKGEAAMANLNMLIVKAQDYGKTSFKGLFNFVRYVELIRKYEIEDGEAGILGEEDNVVRIMTIHKSKGLEFPVCFLAGMEKSRNTTDEKQSIVLDPKYGIGIDKVDIKRRTKKETLYKSLIKTELARENIAEEMRVLYVALTRAKEKLIMIASSKEQTISDLRKTSAISCSSYLDMVSVAEAKLLGLKHTKIKYISEGELVSDRVEQELTEDVAKDDVLELLRDEQSLHLVDDIPEISNPYGYAECEVPVKLSVSDLKHMDIEEKIAQGENLVPDGQKLFAETEPETYIPKFARGENETAKGGTFYGTAFHRILELWNYEVIDVTAADVATFAEDMLNKYQMSKEQVDAIRPEDIAAFLNSSVGKRMYNAKKAGKLYREQPFVIGVSRQEIVNKTAEATEANDEEDIVLIQGIIDAFIEEDDGIMILDYKTDYVTSADMLVNRYKSQLEYYKKALTQITGKHVKELIIYSSRLRKEIIL